MLRVSVNLKVEFGGVCRGHPKYFTLMECCSCEIFQYSPSCWRWQCRIKWFSFKGKLQVLLHSGVFVALANSSISNDNTALTQVTLKLSQHMTSLKLGLIGPRPQALRRDQTRSLPREAATICGGETKCEHTWPSLHLWMSTGLNQGALPPFPLTSNMVWLLLFLYPLDWLSALAVNSESTLQPNPIEVRQCYENRTPVGPKHCRLIVQRLHCRTATIVRAAWSHLCM